jgi:cytoskeletal protein RodZ
MSRKSKRRRLRALQEMPPAGLDAGLEFVDDRDAPPFQPAVVARATEVVSPAAGTPQVSVAASTEAVPAPSGARSPAPGVAPEPGAAAVAAAPAAGVATLGETLATAREARGLSIEDASARTRISVKMLRHLENDRFAEFAADAYARGFLRSYGSFLGLDVTALLHRYDVLASRTPAPEPEKWQPEVEPAPEPAAPSRRRQRRTALVAGGALLGLAAVAAAIFGWQRGFLQLRPGAGLQQIEEELRQAHSEAGPAIDPGPRSPGGGDAAAAATDAPTPESRRGEDTAPPAARPAANPLAATVTDLVEEPAPSRPEGVALAPSESSSPERPRADDPSLVLTATARDSCSLRLQVDADARRAQRYLFTVPGESRSWTARQSFRIVARRGDRLELRLNGRPVPVPADGRTIVLDRSTLQTPPEAAPAPSRNRGSTARRPRAGRGRSTATHAGTSAPALQNAAGPP